MRFSQSVAAVAAFVAVSSALPSAEAETEKLAFTIEQEEPEIKHIKNGLFDMEHFYLRYSNVSAPEELKKMAADARTSGTAPNKAHGDDFFYTTPLLIGQPAQKLNMDLDTGSSDLWVFSKQLPRNRRTGHAVYDPKKSKSSSFGRGLHWSITYGDGSSARGNVYFDKVKLGGVAVKNQAVEAASRVSPSFVQNKPEDGLLGFGFSNINEVRPQQQKTLIDNMSPNLASPLFCARLNHKAAGAYDIGFINKQHYHGKIHYTGITRRNGFWQFRTAGFKVAGGGSGGGFGAIADTGTTLMYLPSRACNAYYSQVRGARYSRAANLFYFPCGTKLPDFTVKIGSSPRTVPGKYMNAGKATRNGEFCAGGIQKNTGVPFGLAILGDTFLKSQYVVFDLGKNRIGFANK